MPVPRSNGSPSTSRYSATGGTLYIDRLQRFRAETGRPKAISVSANGTRWSASKGAVARDEAFITDAVRDARHLGCGQQLRDFIDYGGRGWSALCPALSTRPSTPSSSPGRTGDPLNFGAENGENPRELETAQIIKADECFGRELYVRQVRPDIGTDKIEVMQKGEVFQHDHLRAFRMSKEELVYNWLRYIQQVARNTSSTPANRSGKTSCSSTRSRSSCGRISATSSATGWRHCRCE